MSAIYVVSPGGYVAHIVARVVPSGVIRTLCGKIVAGPGRDDVPQGSRVCIQCGISDERRDRVR